MPLPYSIPKYAAGNIGDINIIILEKLGEKYCLGTDLIENV